MANGDPVTATDILRIMQEAQQNIWNSNPRPYSGLTPGRVTFIPNDAYKLTHEGLLMQGQQAGTSTTTEAVDARRVQRDLQRFGLAPEKREGGSLQFDLLASLAEPDDPPMGDIRWLIERPVRLPAYRNMRNDTFPHIHSTATITYMTQPLLHFGFVRREELEDMPSAYERKMIQSALKPEHGVTYDDALGIWHFAEEF